MISLHDALQDANMPTGQAEPPLKQWRGQFEANNLKAHDFVHFLEAASAAHYNLDENDPGHCTYDEAGAKCSIVDVVEEFICGDNPQTVYEKLAIEGNASSVCGHVFKISEPTYSCRECGMDGTCVLCVTCFKQSAHRNHKYKMGNSGGGGCCDCGDAEAWKRDPACTIHAAAADSCESVTINERMRERCSIVFDAVLQYCIRSLGIESDASLKALDGSGKEDDDVYCTVMYNDETHTFEQVITTLTRNVGCEQKRAVDFVSSIDREGRAVVKCASFDVCIKLKTEIEQSSTTRVIQSSKAAALKVVVLHKNAVACQQLALQLLAWLKDFCQRHAVFRKIFFTIVTSNYNLNHILLNDWKLWKTARTSWHRLLITAMLMEYDNKKQLAVLFTKLYPTLMQDFIRDDHDHSYSIVSLSVQLFTVPSVAQHLIANESAFFKLMHTFYSESIEKHVKRKVLQFAKNAANQNVFKRASFILFDLKYILNFKPDVWTDDLRKNFLHGVQVLMKLLKEMQGMDSVFRQTGQHMEYEPEWEAAFNLHIKLAHVISHVLDWCSTDKVVLVKVYRMVMASLAESEFILAQTVNEVKELADHSTSSLMYDVSSKHVSIHLPLSRFFAGLYLHMAKFDLSFDTISGSLSKPTPEQIIEPVLCTQTMIAQVHSGLWRRNGYSLINQLYFYRNVKCRAEMLDRDVVVLQIGASLIESNEFLIHVMNKFNLISWCSPTFEVTTLPGPEEDTLRQVINMVDEMLELLIVIVGERHVPGIGCIDEQQRLTKELIQQLSIKPFSHSELTKTLSDSQQEDLEQVIHKVADFQKPLSSDKKGVYVLRPEFYDEYNMFFYHYTKEEKSRSEEMHRTRRKDAKQLDCCPPPKLPKLTAAFEMLTNLLQCDVMLLVMQTVLKRSLDLKARCFTDSHLQKVLHLIGYALHEQASGNYEFFTFSDRSLKWNLLPLIEELVNSPRVEVHRDLLLWTIRRFKALQQSSDGNASSSAQNDMQGEEPATVDELTAEAELNEKQQRAKLAAQRRAQIMAQMQNAQKSFMTTNADLFRTSTKSETQPDDEEAAGSGGSGAAMDWQEDAVVENRIVPCLGPDRPHTIVPHQDFICILCSEESIVDRNSPCMVYSAFVQTSKVITHPNDMVASPHVNSCGHVMHATCWTKYFQNEAIKESRRPNRIRAPGTFHIEKNEFLCPLCRCLSNVVLPIATSLSHYTSEPMAAEDVSEDGSGSEAAVPDSWSTLMLEKMSPIPEELSEQPKVTPPSTPIKSPAPGSDDANTPPEHSSPERTHQPSPPPIDFSSWLKVMKKLTFTLKNIDQFVEFTEDLVFLTNFLPDLKPIVTEFAPFESFRAITPLVPRHSIATELTKYINEFIETTRTVAPFPYAAETSEPYLVSWLSLAYTISSQEMWLRALDKPLKGHMSIRQTSCMQGLVRCCGLLSVCATPYLAGKLNVHMRSLLDSMLFDQETSAVEWDVFKMMVSLVFMVPAVLYVRSNECSVPSGNLLEFYLLRLTFAINVAKILMLHDENADDDHESQHHVEDVEMADVSHAADTNNDAIVAFYRKYNFFATEATKSGMSRSRLVKAIHGGSEIFLRRSSLLFHYMTDVEMPDEMQARDGSTFEVMCAYLGLSSDLDSYFEAGSEIVDVMQSMAERKFNDRFRQRIGSPSGDADPSANSSSTPTAVARAALRSVMVPCITPISNFVRLPDDYSDLINSVCHFTCPNNSNDDTRNPTMCLVCGEILCSMTYCCQTSVDNSMVGACTAHTLSCGAGTGVFLRIRDCEVLLLGYNKGCFMAAPYLDEYGESDQGLRRGNALRLCRDRLHKLHLMWLTHCMHENIARLAETSNSMVLTQWQRM